MAKTRNIRKDSAAAVAKAGSRERRAPVQSAGAWTPMRGKRAEGPWRPGKTAAKRGKS